MSNEALKWAWNVRLKSTEKLVLVALSDHANDDDYTCWPSLSRLQRITGLSRPSIWSAIDRLIERRLVARVGAGKRGCTVYRIHVEETGARSETAPEMASEVGNDVTQSRSKLGNEVTHQENPLGNDVTHTRQPPYLALGKEITPNHKENPKEPLSLSRARASEGATPIPDDYHPGEQLAAKCFRAGCPKPGEPDRLARFIAKQQSAGRLSADWDAEYFAWLLREKKFEAMDREREKSKPARRPRTFEEIQAELRGGAPKHNDEEAFDVEYERLD